MFSSFFFIFSLPPNPTHDSVYGMDIKKELEKKIERKKDDIRALEKQLAEASSYLEALEDMRKLLPRDAQSEPEITLRTGSDLANVREVLKKHGKPMHVEELLAKLGKPVAKNSKTSLSGSLASYVREHKIFTRPAPNTFGLVEFAETNKAEPPENFGEPSES
ncbi:MAG: HTH domain-containing protein [Verrucomicrobiota bacterium]|jgi:predicted RNase H-like nuclease (RuvC/YqgF family)